MRVSVEFQDEKLDLEVPDDRLVADWHGPRGVAAAEVPGLIARALEEPVDFPPLRQATVPGDRVVVALGPDVPEAPAVLAAAFAVLEAAGVEPEGLTVLTEHPAPPELAAALPRGVTFRAHDPDDRSQIAYLATTAEGRRVYLNRLLTDADFVLPIGRIGHDPSLGYSGPWGVLYPGLSDAATRQAYRAGAGPAEAGRASGRLKESAEVSWLLGSQFQLGLVAGVTGLVGAVGGLGASVLERGGQQVAAAWGVHVDARAELVVVGVGGPGVAADLGALARGLATARRLVRRGGKVVALSRAVGEIGPSLRRIIEADDPRAGASALRGHEADPDHDAARQIARTLAWADVYLLSGLDPGDVEDLAMTSLERPEEARRLAAVSGSCTFVSQADQARASVADEADSPDHGPS